MRTPKALRMEFDSYAWRLEAGVWVVKQPRKEDEVRCRPRLILVNRSWDCSSSTEYSVIGFIEYDVGGYAKGQARWLVYHYPKDPDGLWAAADEAHLQHPYLDDGEKCNPRPSAREALDYLLEATAPEIPKLEHGALVTTAAIYVPVLETLKNSYARRLQQVARQKVADPIG